MSDYISHHGVKGQRWGVRRYQNPDGSLTEAGKRRYYVQIENHKGRADVETAKLIKKRDRMHQYPKMFWDAQDLDQTIMDRMSHDDLKTLRRLNNEMKVTNTHKNASYQKYLKDNNYHENNNNRSGLQKKYESDMKDNPNKDYVAYQKSKAKYEKTASDLGKSVVGSAGGYAYSVGALSKDNNYKTKAAVAMKYMAKREDNMLYVDYKVGRPSSR